MWREGSGTLAIKDLQCHFRILSLPIRTFCGENVVVRDPSKHFYICISREELFSTTLAGSDPEFEKGGGPNRKQGHTHYPPWIGPW
jgi:hypothetical protein